MNAPYSLWTNVLDMDFAWNENGKIWFVGQKLQYIFCADLEKKEINAVLRLPGASVTGFRRYQQLVKCGNKLVCLPYFNKDILIYNLNDCSVNNILIPDCEEVTEMCCSCAGIVKNKLYIVAGWNIKKILVLDIEEEILKIFDIDCSDINEMIGTRSAIYIDKIYIPVWNKEKVISFDINTYEFKEHLISGDICGCASIYQDGKNCWVIGRNYGIIKWVPDTDEFTEVWNFPTQFKLFSVDEMGEMVDWYAYVEKRVYDPSSMNMFCWEGICRNHHLYILPCFSDSIVQINTDTMQIRFFQFGTEDQKEINQNHVGASAFSLWGCDSDENMYIVSRQDYKIYCIDTKNMSGSSDDWIISEETIHRLLTDLLDEKKIERKSVLLETFIYGVKKECIKEKKDRANNKVGAQIYYRI